MAMTMHADAYKAGHGFALVRLARRIGRVLKAAYAHMIASRELEAQRYVASHLASLSDERLAELGYTRAQVALMPRGHTAL